MIVSTTDLATGTPQELDVPDLPVAEFIHWILTTNAWKTLPELSHRKLLLLRKALLEQSKPAEPTPVRKAKKAAA